MDVTVLRQGAAQFGFQLNEDQIGLFLRYYQALLKWNAKMNLTTVTEWGEVQTDHFLDSLSLTLAVCPERLEGVRFADIGSGAGFPGIPLKIACRAMTGTLIDASNKKIRFLKSMVDDLHLSGLDACQGRAEELARMPEMRGQFDLVVARAVAAMPVLAELTLPFSRVGGLVVLHKTLRAFGEIESARYAIEMLGGQIDKIITSGLDGQVSQRILVVIEKVEQTPSQYPRRSGIPTKRPLSEPC